MGIWNSKTYFDARYFYGNDVFHRLYEVGVLLALGSAVANIQPIVVVVQGQQLHNHRQVFQLCLAMAVSYALAMGRSVEVMISQCLGTKGLYPEAYWAARRDLFYLAGSFAVPLAAAIYTRVKYTDAMGNDQVYTARNYTGAANATEYVGRDRYLAGLSLVDTDDTAIWFLLAGWALSQIVLIVQVMVVLSPSFRKVSMQR
jgi:hypothetical protein